MAFLNRVGFRFPHRPPGCDLDPVMFRIDDGNWAVDNAEPDQVVTDLGSTLRGVTRNSDVIARFGEDMFVCLLPLCNLQGGLVFADRMQDALEDFKKRTGTSVSAVMASHRGEGEGTSSDMVTALEETLMQAQSEGGDRVEVPPSGWNS